jgi:Predicted transcriptional regulators
MSKVGLSNNLRSLRNTYGYTQEDVSIQLNIERQTYNHYENDRRTPALETIIKLADFYQVTIDELICSNIATKMNEKAIPKTLPMRYETKNHVMGLTKAEATHIQTIRSIPLTKRSDIYDFALFKEAQLYKNKKK